MKIKLTVTEVKHKTLLASFKKSKRKVKSPPVKREYKDYNAFLKSNYWKSVRKLVLIRDGFRCRVCSSIDKLHIHHDTYIHHTREHEHLGDLRTLCESCHNKWHTGKKRNKKHK